MDVNFQPIRIEGPITEETGTPRNDGSQGSALYTVTLKLSASAPPEWAEYFLTAFRSSDVPTRFHRPGICSVRGARIVLDGTTMEEVVEAQATFDHATDVANRQYVDHFARKKQAEDEAAGKLEQHKEGIAQAAAKWRRSNQ